MFCEYDDPFEDYDDLGPPRGVAAGVVFGLGFFVSLGVLFAAFHYVFHTV